MKSLLRLILTLTAFLPFLLQSQLIEVSYDIRQGSNQANDTLRIFLQSRNNSMIGIRAVNFSIAFDGGLQNLVGYDSHFAQQWSAIFEGNRVDSVNLSYLGRNYNHRWSYGIADAFLNASSIIMVPADTSAPLKVMEVFFQQLAPGSGYLENENENPINQIGNDNFRQISYIINPQPGVFPVEWSYFEATNLPDGEVSLSWGTTMEINNAWFEVERSDEKDFANYKNLGKVAGKGNSTEESRYNFIDNNLGSGRYYYRIRQIDYDGGYSFSNTISTELERGLFAMFAGPSPAREDINIHFQGVPETGFRIDIYDIRGTIVKRLEEKSPASKRLTITQKVDDLPPGIYFIRSRTLDGTAEAKIARILILR